MDSILLVTVLFDRAMFFIFLADSSPSTSLVASKIQGKIKSSPIVNGFFAFAIFNEIKKEAFKAALHF